MNKMFHADNSDSAASKDPSKASSQKVDDVQVAKDEGFTTSLSQIPLQQHIKEFVDDLYVDVVSPPFQLCDDEIRKIVGIDAKKSELVQPKKGGKRDVLLNDSFELLRKYGRKSLKLDEKLCGEMQYIPSSSTESTIRVAAEKFIHSTPERSNELSMVNHPYPSYLLANPEGVQLLQSLLSCAEKVADNQYERAFKFLKECNKKSYCYGTPIQRLVFYFSRALFEKIANETGRVRPLEEQHADHIESVLFRNMNLWISFQKEHPLSKVVTLVGVQAILDHLKEARNVHIIDLNIRSGVQWIILMQALAARTEHPIHHLKITAVGTRWKSMMEETGRQLAGFAESISLKFTCKIVLVEDFLDLKETLLDVDGDESLAVYAPYIFSTIVGSPNRLDHLMRVMKSVDPCVMIVTELEVNCNSPTFVGRFVESLFFFGAFFDSLEDCFKNDETIRMKAESSWFGLSIRNILAADGEQRSCRHVNINVWRAFFSRLGLIEKELSTSSVDQACLGLHSLPYGSSCTLYRDGKCLTLGWKGSPISSLSAWKF